MSFGILSDITERLMCADCAVAGMIAVGIDMTGATDVVANLISQQTQAGAGGSAALSTFLVTYLTNALTPVIVQQVGLTRIGGSTP